MARTPQITGKSGGCAHGYAHIRMPSALQGRGISTADPHSTMALHPSSRYTCRLPMSSPSPRVSTRLRRAAVAERAQLAKRRERIERARVGVRTELERLERELADIDEHLELLVRIAPSAADDAQPTRQNGDTPREQEPGVARVLQGPAIR